MTPKNPAAWTRSTEVTHFFERFAEADYALLMLDYDGTLAPFTEKRLDAVPYPGVRERLKKLLSFDRQRLVLISGRKAYELQELIALHQPVEIWGAHGREHLAVNGGYSLEALDEKEQTALDEIRMELERVYEAGMLETKPNSVAVHWRGMEDRKIEIERQVRHLFGNYETIALNKGKLQLLSFDGGLEIRAGNIHKGEVVKKLLATLPPNAVAAFLGDDTTDEDAFRAIRTDQSGSEGLTVLVRSESRPSFAQAWLQPPEELIAFLDRWIETAARQKPGLQNADGEKIG